MAGLLRDRSGKRGGWIDVVAPANQALVSSLLEDLHEGESETIALAIERCPDIVFLDESDARKKARAYGLNISGVIGILIRAEKEGKISSLKEELDRLRNDSGFWIGEDAYQNAIHSSEQK